MIDNFFEILKKLNLDLSNSKYYVSCLTIVLASLVIVKAFKKISYRFIIFISLAWLATLVAIIKPSIITDIYEIKEPILIVDKSSSMDEEYLDKITKKTIKFYGLKNTSKVINFGATAEISTVKNYKNSLSDSEFKNESNITKALYLEDTIRDVSSVNKALVISDGYLTDLNDFLESKKTLALFPIYDKSMVSITPSVYITNISAPASVQPFNKFYVSATIKSASGKGLKGKWNINSQENKDFNEKCNGNFDFTESSEKIINCEISVKDSNEIRVQFVAELKTPRNQITKRHIFIKTAKKDKVLVIEGNKRNSNLLTSILKRSKYLVDKIAPSTLRAYTEKLKLYSVIILNNIPIQNISSRTIQELKRLVQDKGVGLFVIGGEKSFGLGGYHKSSINNILPLTSIPPEKKLKSLNNAIALVIDKSRSMREAEKLTFAKIASKEVIQNLKNGDYITVIGFDSTPFIVLPLERMSSSRMHAYDRINRLFPVGSSNIIPALQEARRSLEDVPASKKHIIVLSDGRVTGQSSFFSSFAAQMKNRNISVSSVLLDYSSGNNPLKTLANYSGGLFYQTSNSAELPSIFLSDMKRATGEKTVKESTNFKVNPTNKLYRITKVSKLPNIRGFVKTKLNPNSTLLLNSFDIGKNEVSPLLAERTFGKGKIIALATDLYGRWSPRWLESPQIFKFISDLVSYSGAKSTTSKKLNFSHNYYVNGDSLYFTFTAYDLLNFNKIESILSSTDDRGNITTKDIYLNEIEEGYYQVVIKNITKGDYDLKLNIPEFNIPPFKIVVPELPKAEEKGRGINAGTLKKLGKKTNGKINPPKEEVMTEVIVKDNREISHYFYILAIILFLLAFIL